MNSVYSIKGLEMSFFAACLLSWLPRQQNIDLKNRLRAERRSKNKHEKMKRDELKTATMNTTNVRNHLSKMPRTQSITNNIFLQKRYFQLNKIMQLYYLIWSDNSSARYTIVNESSTTIPMFEISHASISNTSNSSKEQGVHHGLTRCPRVEVQSTRTPH